METDIFSSVLYISVTLVAMVLIARFYRRRRLKHYEVPARDISKGHRWYMVDIFPKPTYCNVNQDHIIHGAQCDSCGICVDDHNMKQANRLIPCKPLSSVNGSTKHHWVMGNLPLCAKCFVCGEDCGILPQLCDWRCCWCQRTVHEECFATMGDICDFGSHKSLIVPPNCLMLKRVGLKFMKGRRQLVVSSVRQPSNSNWTPLIVIANQKSGNNDGEYLLRTFRSILNPAQVIDLHDIPPESGLEWCHLVPNVTCRVLVCGGDGTIGWVLKAIENLKLKPQPQVAILPLGTGNDLSRVLGWGEGYTGEVAVQTILQDLEMAEEVKLDRWKIEIINTKHFGLPVRKKTVIMNNYFSMGVDALVTLNFHKRRESWPSLFANRFINKFCYFTYGTKDVLERECKDLHKKLKVELDDQEIELPEIEGLVVLNIASWGGGVRAWELGGDEGDFVPARYDDRLLEVMALYSSFHIAQLQVGLATPVRLGQARKVKISLVGGNAPVQIDGEPWQQHPATITITHNSQATMLARAQE